MLLCLQVFQGSSSQAEVYEEISQLVQSALDGYKVKHLTHVTFHTSHFTRHTSLRSPYSPMVKPAVAKRALCPPPPLFTPHSTTAFSFDPLAAATLCSAASVTTRRVRARRTHLLMCIGKRTHSDLHCFHASHTKNYLLHSLQSITLLLRRRGHDPPRRQANLQHGTRRRRDEVRFPAIILRALHGHASRFKCPAHVHIVTFKLSPMSARTSSFVTRRPDTR